MDKEREKKKVESRGRGIKGRRRRRKKKKMDEEGETKKRTKTRRKKNGKEGRGRKQGRRGVGGGARSSVTGRVYVICRVGIYVWVREGVAPRPVMVSECPQCLRMVGDGDGGGGEDWDDGERWQWWRRMIKCCRLYGSSSSSVVITPAIGRMVVVVNIDSGSSVMCGNGEEGWWLWQSGGRVGRAVDRRYWRECKKWLLLVVVVRSE